MKKNFINKLCERKYPYVIAEIGINHNGDMNLAREMIDAAVQGKADCVKFQNFYVDKYISPFATKASYDKQSNSNQLRLQMRPLH